MVEHSESDEVEEMRSANPILSLYGFSIACLSRKAQLWVLAMTMMACHLLHGICTEHISRDILGGLVWSAAAMELCVYALLSGIELTSTGERVKWMELPLLRYLLIAVTIAAGRGLTWVAYGQVSYPTVLLFKSSKIIVVMFSAVIILRKSFLPAEYAASLLAVTGLYTFSRADLTFKASTEDRGDTVHGVTVMLCAVGCEALVSTLQEYCLRKLHRPLAELICITNSLGAVLLVSVSLVHGDAAELRARLSTSVQPVVWVLGAVTLAYGGTYAFTSCIMGFGAVVATGLGIIRKLLSVVLSFLLFPKPFGVAHAAGLGIFFSGLVVAWTVDWDKHGAVEGKVPQTVQGGYAELSQEAEGGENLRPRRQISHSHSHEKMEGERVMLERSRHGIITNLGSEVPAGPGS